MKSKVFLVILLIASFVLFTTNAYSADWILSSNSGKLPADLEALVQKAGGTLVSSLDDVGIATVEFATREEAEAMEAYGLIVMPDISLNWVKQDYLPQAQAEHIGLNEPHYGFQWHLPVIEADKAWEAGYTGAGARVAIVDSGIWYLHPDLMGNIDFVSSASFVPGKPDFIDENGHGTHVAGIVAAANNDWGSIGVAPDATLIAIRVMDESGSGSVSWTMAGIIHAAKQNVDIINLSLGNYIKKNGLEGGYTAHDAAKIVSTYRRVLNWASAQGCLLVCSAGNDTMDLDHNRNIIKLPAEASHGVIVAATGPTGLQNFDTPASYSNYGTSSITVAAPGGDGLNMPNAGWWLDMVLSTSIQGWSFMAGTSQATPVASGVAALIVSKYGKMSPGELKNKLCRSTDDLGKPGTDPHYGKGRVNAYKAVTK